MTKLKAFADDKINVAKMTISLSNRVENTEGKGENAGYQHFLPFFQCFLKPSPLGSLKVGIVWLRVKGREKRAKSLNVIQIGETNRTISGNLYMKSDLKLSKYL